MATKTAAKKTTTSRKTAAKKTTARKNASRMPMYLTKEKYPNEHQVTGKYKFFYCLFALTTIIFAVLAVWLFVFSSEILNKYESIEACARTHGATCEVRINDDSVNVEE
ncbi:hypothetical protein IJ102_03180 [Candidatus Saccharibacteria bacterium]|nr:hypothetical protein [Candidatus Saccharibacteria bacterium]